MSALGMVLMVVGGLLLLSSIRSFALYRANRRQPSTRAGGAVEKMLTGMLVAGTLLVAAGAALAF